MAPEHPYPAALEDVIHAYQWLVKEKHYRPGQVVVAGDSAGGGLALALCLYLRDHGMPQPAGLVLMSPWTDMTASGPSYTERQDIDPMLTMEYIKAVRSAYAGGADLSSPDLSPLLGDCSGFPPTLIQVGTYEILYSDAEGLRDKLLAAHIPCTFQVYDEMWHVFQMFPLKKAAAAMNNVGYFLLEQQ